MQSISHTATPGTLPASSGAGEPNRARILVIDDDPAVCRMLQLAIEICGHEVLTISNARQALSFIETEPVDLVITDLVMPEVEGIEIIMRLNHVHPSIPILAISGEGADGPDEYLSIARLLGAHRTLPKPFDCRQLMRVVDELLENRE
jgi:DNA-binding NtrC family response regulator